MVLDKQEQPVSVEKKRKIQQPSIFVSEEIKRGEHAIVCPKNAKRRQMEERCTIEEVKMMLEQGVEEMVGNLKEKLQAKQKELSLYTEGKKVYLGW